MREKQVLRKACFSVPGWGPGTVGPWPSGGWTASHQSQGAGCRRGRSREWGGHGPRQGDGTHPPVPNAPEGGWGQTEGLQALSSPSWLRVSWLVVPKVQRAPSWEPESDAPCPEGWTLMPIGEGPLQISCATGQCTCVCAGMHVCVCVSVQG